MPLPEGKTPWPPQSTRVPAELYEKWGAWYEGDPQRLSEVYRNHVGTMAVSDARYIARPAQYQGGIVGAAARFFWGAPPPRGALSLAKLHLPLPADIAATSADLVFSESPKIRVSGSATGQDRLESMIGEGGGHAILIEAAELCSAFSGVYLRVMWDKEIADHVLWEACPPDNAVPEWRAGRLKTVTFWHELQGGQGGYVWRHLERHEPGIILHGLYRGDNDNLGMLRDLTERPETEELARQVNAAGGITTGSTGLTAQYVPNIRPVRDHRLRGQPLGRSDYAGNEGLYDALDEVWTSLISEMRKGKGRLVVPESMLTHLGPGRGGYFDADQELFLGVEALQTPGANGLPIHNVQFDIRVEKYLQIATSLAENAMRGSGYSVATFGEQGDVQQTATESTNRDKLTNRTRDRKIEYWRPPLARFCETSLQVDRHVFGTDGITADAKVELEWPAAIQPDPEARARTLQILRAATLMSRRTGLIELHPDWDKPQIDTELDEIREEESEGVDPEVPPPGTGPGERTAGDERQGDDTNAADAGDDSDEQRGGAAGGGPQDPGRTGSPVRPAVRVPARAGVGRR